MLIDWRIDQVVRCKFLFLLLLQTNINTDIKVLKKGNNMFMHIHELINPLLLLFVSEDFASLSN